MNKAIDIINDDPDASSIKVRFNPLSNGHIADQGKEYTYLTGLDVEPGDFVIVESQDEFKVVLVTAVCPNGSFIDPKAKFDYQWAFQKVAVKLKKTLDKFYQDFESWA